MSTNVARGLAQGQMPAGTQVALYKTYPEATAAVEKLGEADFPLASVAIVGSDLHIVEDVLGRLTPARVALSGASQGLVWGLVMGLFALVAFQSLGPYVALITLAMAVLVGVTLNVVMWVVSAKKKSYYSRSSMAASRYAILVTEQADRAFKLLAGDPGNTSGAPKRPVRLSGPSPRREAPSADSGRENRQKSKLVEPPKYGVRLSDAKTGSKATAELAERELEEIEESVEATGD